MKAAIEYPEPDVKHCGGYTLIGVRDQTGKRGKLVKISPATTSEQIIGQAALDARLAMSMEAQS